MPRTILVDFPDGDPITALEERMTATEARLAALENAPPTQPPVEPPTEPEHVIHVSLTGNDKTGDGTTSRPYRTLAAALDHAHPGSTIQLAPGEYDAHGIDTHTELRAYGTALAPITIQAPPGTIAWIDGRNNPNHPRVLGDTSNPYEPRLLTFVGEHTIWQRIGFRNGYGGGFRAFSLDSKYLHCVFRNNHATGFDLQGSRNEVAHCIFIDNNSVSNDGNSGNGQYLTYTDKLQREDRFPNETGSRHNHIHHNVAAFNSDDGFSAGTSVGPNVFEHNVAFANGIGASGNGVGFKMGLGHTNNTRNVCRHNLAWDNSINYDTNTSEGIVFENNTSWNGGDGFILTTHRTNACDNAAHSNLSIRDDGGFNRVRGDCTVDTHNVGWPRTWLGRETLLVGDPRILSFDPDSRDFLVPAPDSPLAGAGKDGVDVGAIPAGGVFAGGWDWRALVRAHPHMPGWPL